MALSPHDSQAWICSWASCVLLQGKELCDKPDDDVAMIVGSTKAHAAIHAMHFLPTCAKGLLCLELFEALQSQHPNISLHVHMCFVEVFGKPMR